MVATESETDGPQVLEEQNQVETDAEPSIEQRMSFLENELAEVKAMLEQLLKGQQELLRSARGINQDSYSIEELASMLGKAPFTVREWCRLGRINATKRKGGRGNAAEWNVARHEIERYLSEGLLPRAAAGKSDIAEEASE